MKKNIIKLATLALLFTACEHTVVPEQDLFLTEEAAQQLIAEDGGRELTLNQLLDEYMTEEGNFLSETTPYRTRATNGKDGIYVFSIDTLPSVGQALYIRGRVITEDHAGNFYKSMVIQQIVDGKQQALRLSVDASSVSGQYAIGQEILIKVNGFAIGRYANQPQLCIPSYNNNIYANNAEQKVGWAPGRIPFSRFQKATQRIGLPDKSKIQTDTILITEFTNLPVKALADQKAIRYMDGMLVCIKDVHFTGQYADTYGDLVDCTTGDPETVQNANVFAPTTNNIGFPQSRVIAHTDTIITIDPKTGEPDTTYHHDYAQVSTSEYAKFARFYLPGCNASGVSGAKTYKGSVTGILGYYRDNPRYDADQWDWSITLRSLSDKGWGTEQDLKLKDANGTSWIPQEYGTK